MEKPTPYTSTTSFHATNPNVILLLLKALEKVITSPNLRKMLFFAQPPYPSTTSACATNPNNILSLLQAPEVLRSAEWRRYRKNKLKF